LKKRNRSVKILQWKEGFFLVLLPFMIVDQVKDSICGEKKGKRSDCFCYVRHNKFSDCLVLPYVGQLCSKRKTKESDWNEKELLVLIVWRMFWGLLRFVFSQGSLHHVQRQKVSNGLICWKENILKFNTCRSMGLDADQTGTAYTWLYSTNFWCSFCVWK
jgi:hypothetical protein